MANNSYITKSKPYMTLHHDQIEALREIAKTKVHQSFRIASFICDCGHRVSFHTYRFHLATMKHRKICGDLPDPSAVDSNIEIGLKDGSI